MFFSGYKLLSLLADNFTLRSIEKVVTIKRELSSFMAGLVLCL